MAQPGTPGAIVGGEDAWVRRIQDLERTVRELAAANPFAPMGITPSPGGFAVTGTLSLPPGSIDNSALASPVSPGSANLTQQNFSIATTEAVYAQASIVVPAGYSQALVINGVSAGATNSGAATDFLYVTASINGVAGGEQPSQTLAGAYGSGSAFAIRTLSGLSGGSITVECGLRTGTGAWASATGNTASVNALILFLK